MINSATKLDQGFLEILGILAKFTENVATRHSSGLTFAVLEQQVPNASTGVGVHPSCGLIQDHNLRTPHKCYGHRQLPLHTT